LRSDCTIAVHAGNSYAALASCQTKTANESTSALD
jgi:hypothetical protein